MNKIYLPIIFILISLNTFGQNTYVPDDNFEQYLISQGYDDVLDNNVLTSNINTITTLNLRQKQVLDLTGINDFVALKELNISNNLVNSIGYLTIVDITGLINLEELDASYNTIESIDLSNNTKLIEVNLEHNKISTVNLTNALDLEVLKFGDNQLASIDITQNIKLAFVEIDNNLLTGTLDLSSQSLLSKLDISFNEIDNLLLNPSCKDILGDINIEHNKITNIDLTDYVELFYAYLGYNELTSVTLANNRSLYKFTVNDNNLTSFDFNISYRENGSSKHLELIDCSRNNLTSFTISPKLGSVNSLYCSKNNLTSFAINGFRATKLDISNNTGVNLTVANSGSIENLIIDNNDLTSLNISPFNLSYLSCKNNKLTVLNDINNLYTLDCSNNEITSLTITTDSKIQDLSCNSNELTSIDVLPENLKSLNCRNNEISTLNLDNVSAWYFTSLRCDTNKIKSLDLERFSALYNIYCSHNEITELNLTNQSYNNPIYYLYCNDNKLTELDLRNIYIDEYSYPRPFDTRNNPDLTCIYVSDKDHYEPRFTNIDSQTHYVLDEDECNSWSTWVDIPDSKFENALIEKGIDDVADGKVLKHDIMDITELVVENLKIRDLTGIEEFDKLEELSFSRNYISTINLSNNIYLRTLNCSMNPVLASIDVSDNPQLWFINCSVTSISELDVTNNTLLRYLYCDDNSISSLDLSHNNYMRELIANNCELTSLDLRNIDYTNIETLDVTNNLDLKCIYTDDVDYCNSNFIDIDNTSSFVIDEDACNALSVESFDVSIKLNIYPNPASDIVNINTFKKIKEITIYNLSGNIINTFSENTTTINIKEYPKGTYFIYTQTDEGNAVNKLIIK